MARYKCRLLMTYLFVYFGRPTTSGAYVCRSDSLCIQADSDSDLSHCHTECQQNCRHWRTDTTDDTPCRENHSDILQHTNQQSAEKRAAEKLANCLSS